SPLRTTRTFSAQSNMSGPTNISLNQAARTAGSTLVAIVSVGKGRTPSLMTRTSRSPTLSAYREGTRSSASSLLGLAMVSSCIFNSFRLPSMPRRQPGYFGGHGRIDWDEASSEIYDGIGWWRLRVDKGQPTRMNADLSLGP